MHLGLMDVPSQASQSQQLGQDWLLTVDKVLLKAIHQRVSSKTCQKKRRRLLIKVSPPGFPGLSLLSPVAEAHGKPVIVV